ncbi:DNA-binding response regulator [Cohnella pontilimi]|uniref:DNA-binding response regulator n=1 Tax=Cohnella pontilimi TaxID=2564100 RepID=A0A4U0FHI4_9BACL|nr:DNA-binding response regulator [Cohnella pontilimi]TJY44486.1 DNA-binding response regulator [Cohnella pontilimi]
MGFEEQYSKWLESHMSRRTGESRRRLKEGHGYGEKLFLEQVWWPVVGNFDDLHPEYEFVDKDGSYYYLDFAYLRIPQPTAIEVDGFATHARDMDRWEFRKDRRRQNAIVLRNWNILRFSTDDLKDDLTYCRKTIAEMLGAWYGENAEDTSKLPLRKREILRLAVRVGNNDFGIADACACLGVGDRSARQLLHEMVDEGYLESASGTARIHRYRLAGNKTSGTQFR